MINPEMYAKLINFNLHEKYGICKTANEIGLQVLLHFCDGR